MRVAVLVALAVVGSTVDSEFVRGMLGATFLWCGIDAVRGL